MENPSENHGKVYRIHEVKSSLDHTEVVVEDVERKCLVRVDIKVPRIARDKELIAGLVTRALYDLEQTNRTGNFLHELLAEARIFDTSPLWEHELAQVSLKGYVTE